MSGFHHSFVAGNARYLVYIVEAGRYTLEGASIELKRTILPEVHSGAASDTPSMGTAYLEEKPISSEMIKHAIRRQTLANKFIPVVGGSAFKNKGVQYLVDAVIDAIHERKPEQHRGDVCAERTASEPASVGALKGTTVASTGRSLPCAWSSSNGTHVHTISPGSGWPSSAKSPSPWKNSAR